MTDKEKLEIKIAKMMLPVETAIMMSDNADDVVLLAIGMLRKAILILENQYNRESRIALVERFNK